MCPCLYFVQVNKDTDLFSLLILFIMCLTTLQQQRMLHLRLEMSWLGSMEQMLR